MKIRVGGIGLIVAMFILGSITGFFLCGTVSKAHPCDYDNSVCHYVQVVNPITGKLEQQYVCE